DGRSGILSRFRSSGKLSAVLQRSQSAINAAVPAHVSLHSYEKGILQGAGFEYESRGEGRTSKRLLLPLVEPKSTHRTYADRFLKKEADPEENKRKDQQECED